MHPWALFIAGFFGCLVVCAGLIRWVAPLGFLDHPAEDRRIHARSTARTGGMALWLVVLGVQATGALGTKLDGLDWAAVHVMALVGLLDDRFNLRSRYKAMAGLGVAVLLALHVAHTLGRGAGTVLFMDLSLPTHPAMVVPILVLWFWAVPQAYNLIDGINGLSIGFGTLLLGVLGWNLGVQPLLLWGGLLAVFLLNYPRAYHFMGDCGALMLGTFFSLLAVKAFALQDPILMLWVFAYPTVDVCLVVGIRAWKGQPLGAADCNHLHHWMRDRMGSRPWWAAPILLVLAALPMARATALPGHHGISLLGLIVLLLLALKVFKDRVAKGPEKQVAEARVCLEVPVIEPRATREASNTDPGL